MNWSRKQISFNWGIALSLFLIITNKNLQFVMIKTWISNSYYSELEANQALTQRYQHQNKNIKRLQSEHHAKHAEGVKSKKAQRVRLSNCRLVVTNFLYCTSTGNCGRKAYLSALQCPENWTAALHKQCGHRPTKLFINALKL